MNETKLASAAATWRRSRLKFWLWSVILLAITSVTLWSAADYRHHLLVHRLEADCKHLEAEGNWSKLLLLARDWRRIEPRRREALLAGATAAKELRNAAMTADFLSALPRESVSEAPWLSMLADLQFGRLQEPMLGARTCHEILRLNPRAVHDRQKLIFFYAVTAQPVDLLETVRNGASTQRDLPEFYVYAFMAADLRIHNALERLEHWMKGLRSDETLMVAYALHKARRLDGSIPSVNEERAGALRNAQAQRTKFLDQLHMMFPRNHQLQVYDLEEAIKSGDTKSVLELLSRAGPAADKDFRCWRARGWLFLQVRQYDKARTAFDEALRLHPIDWRTRYYLADWSRRTGDLEFAEQQHCLAAKGKSLETALMGSPDVHSISQELYREMADVAEKSSDTLIASRLLEHLEKEPSAEIRLESSSRHRTQLRR